MTQNMRKPATAKHSTAKGKKTPRGDNDQRKEHHQERLPGQGRRDEGLDVIEGKHHHRQHRQQSMTEALSVVCKGHQP